MTERPPQSSRAHGRAGDCPHPWLRVVCGECGEPVDMDAPFVANPSGQAELPAVPPGSGETQGVFIVARGHPELVEQLKAVMGPSADVKIIEDRRRTPREAGSPEDVPPISRTELRKRLLEDGTADPGGAG